MAKHHRPSADDPSAGPEVVDRTTYWSVDDCHWPAVSPQLPVEMVDLLAPPIVVGVARVPVTSRATPPGAPATPPGAPATPPGAPAIWPAGPGGSVPVRCPAPVPGQTGRHRRAKEPAERG
ncbi:hypothetical protein [Micromonospora sp. NPDC050200]|uniref:hypothetical protein n=1 Tax=Micromonospora sp. NPDC050200 TaxID=3155664 RepID=UPI0033D92A69